MKKNWMKWALCLVLAVGMLTCVALAADNDPDVAVNTEEMGAVTITVVDGKLTVTVPADKVVEGDQYAILMVKTTAEGADVNAMLNDVKANGKYSVDVDTSILYIDQKAASSGLSFEGKPKSISNAVILLGGKNADGTVGNARILGVIKAKGYTVSGEVTVKGAAATDTAAVELNGETKNVTLTSGKGPYSFEAIPDGTYKLKVSGTAGKYVAREYDLTVDGAEVTQAVDICPKGDANIDGDVLANDTTAIFNHLRLGSTNKLTGYGLACADANGDGDVIASDTTAIFNHLRLGSTNKLW